MHSREARVAQLRELEEAAKAASKAAIDQVFGCPEHAPEDWSLEPCRCAAGFKNAGKNVLEVEYHLKSWAQEVPSSKLDPVWVQAWQRFQAWDSARDWTAEY